jgi:hypothetical protein
MKGSIMEKSLFHCALKCFHYGIAHPVLDKAPEEILLLYSAFT